jgi:hypothetical protein
MEAASESAGTATATASIPKNSFPLDSLLTSNPLKTIILLPA